MCIARVDGLHGLRWPQVVVRPELQFVLPSCDYVLHA
jgi:hypothetical protein